VTHEGDSVGVGAVLLLATVGLSACGAGSAGTSARDQPPRRPAPSVSLATSAAPPTTSAALSRCATDSLTVRLGTKAPAPDAIGQYEVPVLFTNIGTRTCTLRGWPTAELRGPNDPNGPTYQLPQAAGKPSTVELPVRGTAEAIVTYLKYEPGDMGTLGSTSWRPMTIAITPPGDVGELIAQWTPRDPVLRQDEASHPGTYVAPVTPA
jgi:hypothetical protein